jgi:protein-S-isoprenylcysteine O-methyltransferase Ste14
MVRALTTSLFSTLLFGSALLGPTQDWYWPAAWVLIGVFLLIHLVGTTRIHRANPGLLPERSKLLHGGQPITDKILLIAFMATYAGMLVITGTDRHRWHPSPALPVGLSWIGLAMFAAGWILVMRALETNAFATSVVRHQADRGHALVDFGIYRHVRHPMYAGLIAVLLGVPLWLRSALGLAFALVPIAVLLLRIELEESLLRRVLPDYPAYTRRVRSRVVPGVW